MPDIRLKRGTAVTLESGGGTINNTHSAEADDADINNDTVLALAYDFELNAGFAASVTTGSIINLYLVPRLNGSDLAAHQSGATPLFSPEHFAGSFVTPTAGTALRRMTVQDARIGPNKYRAFLLNLSGQTISSGWTLTAYPVLKQV